ncbi:MAG: hypothetical protein ACRDKI_06730 [Solirubrobacterales bacterium]
MPTAKPAVPLVAPAANTAHSSAVIALGGLLNSLLGGVFAFAVTAILGEGPSVDGFFAAFSIYTIFIIFGQTMRVALVPQLGPSSEQERFTENGRDALGRLLPQAMVLSVICVAVAPLIGELLMRNASTTARNAATMSIAILAVASFFQFWAASQSAVLAGAKRFAGSSVIYVISGTISLVSVTILASLFDTPGAPIGMLIGAISLGAMHMVFLRRFGFHAHPQPRKFFQQKTWLIGGRMATAAILPILIQLQLTIALSQISGFTGAVTGYTYGYLAMSVLAGMTVGAISLSTMPTIVASIEREGRAAAIPYIRDVSSQTLFLYLPLATAYALFGYPAIKLVFGDFLKPTTLALFWDSTRVFLLLGLTWSVFTPFTNVALAQRRYRLLALVAIAMLPVNIAILLIPGANSGFDEAIAHTVSGAVLFWTLGFAILGLTAFAAIWAIVRKAWPAAALSCVFVALALIPGTTDSLGASLACIIGGGIFYLAVAFQFWHGLGRPMILQLLSRETAPEPF